MKIGTKQDCKNHIHPAQERGYWGVPVFDLKKA